MQQPVHIINNLPESMQFLVSNFSVDVKNILGLSIQAN